jgi:phage protein D
MIQDRSDQTASPTAEEAYKEAAGHFRRVSDTLQGIEKLIRSGEPDLASKILVQIQLLDKAFFTLKTAEEAFHATYGRAFRAGDFDLEAARDSIGSKLDRLREP